MVGGSLARRSPCGIPVGSTDGSSSSTFGVGASIMECSLRPVQYVTSHAIAAPIPSQQPQ
eukprot:4401353-Amphidinium_carterae.2